MINEKEKVNGPDRREKGRKMGLEERRKERGRGMKGKEEKRNEREEHGKGREIWRKKKERKRVRNGREI